MTDFRLLLAHGLDNARSAAEKIKFTLGEDKQFDSDAIDEFKNRAAFRDEERQEIPPAVTILPHLLPYLLVKPLQSLGSAIEAKVFSALKRHNTRYYLFVGGNTHLLILRLYLQSLMGNSDPEFSKRLLPLPEKYRQFSRSLRRGVASRRPRSGRAALRRGGAGGRGQAVDHSSQPVDQSAARPAAISSRTRRRAGRARERNARRPFALRGIGAHSEQRRHAVRLGPGRCPRQLPAGQLRGRRRFSPEGGCHIRPAGGVHPLTDEAPGTGCWRQAL